VIFGYLSEVIVHCIFWKMQHIYGSLSVSTRPFFLNLSVHLHVPVADGSRQMKGLYRSDVISLVCPHPGIVRLMARQCYSSPIGDHPLGGHSLHPNGSWHAGTGIPWHTV